MPILSFDSLDLVPEGLREYAKTVEGGNGRVNINVVAAQKVDEFRDNNIKLSKERDDLRSLMEPLKNIVGEDVDAFQKHLDELRLVNQRVKDGELKETRSIEEALAKRTEELRKDYDGQLQKENKEKVAWRQKYDALEGQYRKSLVVAALKDAIMEPDSGIDPKAAAAVTRAGLEVFKCDDKGNIIAMDGEATIYGSDGMSSLTPREWLVRLREEQPFYFKASHGGGAGGEGVTTKRIHGVDANKVKQMTAQQRLALANGEKVII